MSLIKLLISGSMLLAKMSFAQDTLAVAEQPGGASKLMSYLSKEIKIPEAPCSEETHLGCQKVFIKFAVDTTGKVSDPRVISKLGLDCPGFGEEIIKAVMAMPAWKPAMQDGKKVKVYYSVPVYIRTQ